MQVTDAHLRLRPRSQGLGRQGREGLRPESEHHLGEEIGEVRLEPHRPRHLPPRARHAVGEEHRYLLVRAVLKQAGEEQVARLEECEILLVFDLPAGQETRSLEIQEGRRNDQELRGFVEVPLGPLGAQVRDEFVGDDMQREFGHLELVLGDELQKQVEGPLEGPYGDREGRSRSSLGLFELLAGHRGLSHLAMSSRASCR